MSVIIATLAAIVLGTAKGLQLQKRLSSHTYSWAEFGGSGKKLGLGCEVELCLFETAVRDSGSDLKNPMSADWCPTHLPLLIHTGIDEAVG
ncbi:hypothetical protein, partial [Ensifer sp. 22564]|uniref:hypothetical protein n=1 Tax=Ensifer sp. 22564 TaxID=3453943 RepID=UPI003F877871